MHINLISLFPEMFRTLSVGGVTGRSLEQNILTLHTYNPRDFTEDSYRTVDDRPYGGGPGMLMLAAPLLKAIAAAQARVSAPADTADQPHAATQSETTIAEPSAAHVIALAPHGAPLTHQRVCELAQLPALILVCGRYEGIDERVAPAIDETLSIGDYVLSGGELPAMVLCDAIARQLPGTLGDAQSAVEDSFVDGLLDHPHYTRPATLPSELGGASVPDVLLGGNHQVIADWRLQQRLGRTWQQRPDLLAKRPLNAKEAALLEAFIAQSNAQT